MRREERRNPHRLYRSREHRILFGVCAGIAEYWGFSRCGVRVAAIIGAICFPPFVIPAYLIMALVVPRKPVEVNLSEEQQVFWRDVSTRPADLFGSLHHRFRELDLRLQRIEAYVTSKEFEMDRELGRGRDPA